MHFAIYNTPTFKTKVLRLVSIVNKGRVKCLAAIQTANTALP